MIIPSQRIALRKAVDAYRSEQEKMEPWAYELLNRLARSDEAAQAFERLKLKDGRERQFLMLCILVAQLALELPKRISTQKKMVKQLKELDKAITALRSFVSEHVLSRSDLLIPRLDQFPMWGFFQPPDDAVAMTRGIELIAEAIKKQRTVMAEYGATRKKRQKHAPNIAAIKFLAEGVRRLTGKLHESETRDIALVILGSELPEKSVTYALRPQKERVRRR
jgi:hypothetical protein